jgi:hypothetical protein
LLRRLIIYSRAGQRERVRDTLLQLGALPDWPCKNGVRYCVLGDKIRYTIGQDLSGWKVYYERTSPADQGGAEAFVGLWQKEDDLKELDQWLASRSTGYDEWFRQRLYLRSKLGTANELLEPLVAAVKANPGDLDAAVQYLRVVSWAGGAQNVDWVANVSDLKTAYENFELGRELEHRASKSATLLYEKSLRLPLTELDAHLVGTRAFLYVQMTPTGINYAKQLRFWTKLGLARGYRVLGRTEEAQRLVEELAAMKGKDILSEDFDQVAGAVQASSGQRVIERSFLQNEAPRGNTASYWLERANYFSGRDDYGLEKDTYLKALNALSSDASDKKGLQERFEVARAFAYFLEREKDQNKEWQKDLEQLLKREFSLAPPETTFAYSIAELIMQNEFELEDLLASLLTNQPRTLARLLDARPSWGNDEEYFIEHSFGRDIAPAQAEKIWSSLERLVSNPASDRAYTLACAMVYQGATERAAVLLIAYLKSTPAGDVRRADAIEQLVRAFCANGKWRAAENLLLENKQILWRFVPSALAMIAESAARAGASSDAVRIWRMRANLYPRDLTGLESLAKTSARAELLAFYAQMKKDDPLSWVPDAASRILQ